MLSFNICADPHHRRSKRLSEWFCSQNNSLTTVHRSSKHGKVLFFAIVFVALSSWGDFCKLTCEECAVSEPSSTIQSWKISTACLICEEWVSLRPSSTNQSWKISIACLICEEWVSLHPPTRVNCTYNMWRMSGHSANNQCWKVSLGSGNWASNRFFFFKV